MMLRSKDSKQKSQFKKISKTEMESVSGGINSPIKPDLEKAKRADNGLNTGTIRRPEL